MNVWCSIEDPGIFNMIMNYYIWLRIFRILEWRNVTMAMLNCTGCLNPTCWDFSTQNGAFCWEKNIGGCSEGAQISIKWIAESENSTVEWFRNPVNSPVEVGSLSSLYIYQGFRRIPGGLKSPGFSVCHQRCMLLLGAGLTTCFASNEPTPSQRNIRCDFLPGKDGDTWRIIPVS